MTDRQTILELLSGKRIDNQPAFSGLIHVTAEGLQKEGLVFHEIHKEARKMARASASTFKWSGLPSAVTISRIARNGVRNPLSANVW